MPSSKGRAPAKVRTMGYTTEFDGSVQAIFYHLVFPAGCGAVIVPQPAPVRLTGFHHLVKHRRAGELLPARLRDDAPELIGAVRGPEVRLRLLVRDVHPPVRSVGGDGPVQ